MQKCNEGAMVDIGFPISIQLYLRLLDWIHLLIEDQIPLEYCFPQILWKTEIQGIYGKLNFPSIHLRWKIIISQILWKTEFHCIVVHINWWKPIFHEFCWKLNSTKIKESRFSSGIESSDSKRIHSLTNHEQITKKQERNKSWYYNREVKSKSLQRKTCWVEDDFLFSSDLAFYFDF